MWILACIGWPLFAITLVVVCRQVVELRRERGMRAMAAALDAAFEKERVRASIVRWRETAEWLNEQRLADEATIGRLETVIKSFVDAGLEANTESCYKHLRRRNRGLSRRLAGMRKQFRQYTAHIGALVAVATEKDIAAFCGPIIHVEDVQRYLRDRDALDGLTIDSVWLFEQAYEIDISDGMIEAAAKDGIGVTEFVETRYWEREGKSC